MALSLFALVRDDFRAVLARDPSRRSRLEAALHPPLYAVATYRVAHALYNRRHRLSALALTFVARTISGVEIHPGAKIGRRAFIDHGFGVVIGETAEIGDDVTLYHHVTLGSRGWWRDSSTSLRRHPRLGDRVSVGCGASLLGPLTVMSDTRVPAHTLLVGGFDTVAPDGALCSPAVGAPATSRPAPGAGTRCDRRP